MIRSLKNFIQKTTQNREIDFLAIGDIVNDDFIELDENHASITEDKNKSIKLCMNMGDKLPYKSRKLIYAVGNSPNAAVSAHRLGLKSALMTHIGDDELGKNTLKQIKNNGISDEFITIEKGAKTNYHFVLRLKAERTILINHYEYTYNLKKQIKNKPKPKWIYFSSVGKNSLEYHKDIADWVKNEEIKMAFQPGSFQIMLGYEKLKEVYEASTIFFANVEEVESILKPLLGAHVIEKEKENTRQPFVKFLLHEMQKLGPKIVCITDGPNGAYTIGENGEAYYIKPYPDPAKPVDRTGAGDSFSSTFTSAIILGKSIPEALSWGPINSMSVVQYIGAQEGLLSRDKLEKYLAEAPEYYKPEKI